MVAPNHQPKAPHPARSLCHPRQTRPLSFSGSLQAGSCSAWYVWAGGPWLCHMPETACRSRWHPSQLLLREPWNAGRDAGICPSPLVASPPQHLLLPQPPGQHPRLPGVWSDKQSSLISHLYKEFISKTLTLSGGEPFRFEQRWCCWVSAIWSPREVVCKLGHGIVGAHLRSQLVPKSTLFPKCCGQQAEVGQAGAFLELILSSWGTSASRRTDRPSRLPCDAVSGGCSGAGCTQAACCQPAGLGVCRASPACHMQTSR